VKLIPLLALVAFDDAKPVLEKRCFACHGPKLAMHGLRLDSLAAALKGGESGAPSIIPGDSAASLLIRYVSGKDKDIVMPPSGPRLTQDEIATLAAWIDGEKSAPVAATTKPKGWDHWSFQPIRAPGVPAVKLRDWVANPIDAFVLAKLEARGWTPSAPASRAQLIRRYHLDLVGLPPTLEEQATTDSLDSIADSLLRRSGYGERWGRHWLDLVRYAESNGYERDGHKPEAYRYRDYVVNAFNSDKPFDRFIAEQLAGDELDDANAETLVATGYNRLGPWDDEPADPLEDRFDQLDDIVSTTSQVFLGLTLGCARCHNHKFDPLTAQDYYSMVAIFNGLERPRRGRTELTLPIGSRSQVDRERERDRRLAAHAARAAVESMVAGAGGAHLAAIERTKRAEPDLPRGYFLHEPAPPPKTHLLVRGKATRPGPEVPPAVPAVLVASQPVFAHAGRTSGRRLALARWLASHDNPLTARVIVNRVWQFHFGEGLVRTSSDFGTLGQRPTHPELLDWLAAWFMDNGWSFKKLHRLILASSTYRMSKQSRGEQLAADPENRLLWRFPYRRLEAEAIRDSMLAVSGRLNPKAAGPSMFPEVPEAAMAGSSDPDKIWKVSDEEERSRRTVYTFIKRSLVVPMLEVLDLCDTARTSAQRMTTSVAPQALTLFNGDFVNAQSRHFAERLRREAGPDAARQIDLAYRLALARPPTPAERSRMLAFLQRESLEQLARVILNLNEFVYAD
jgi:cytochrome c551/c552